MHLLQGVPLSSIIAGRLVQICLLRPRRHPEGSKGPMDPCTASIHLPSSCPQPLGGLFDHRHCTHPVVRKGAFARIFRSP